MSNGRLELIQTDGYLVRPGAKPDTEKNMFIQLLSNGYAVPGLLANEGEYWMWLGSVDQYILQGTYKNISTSKDLKIGDGSPIEAKFWRYNVNTHQLEFCTLSKKGGGGLGYAEYVMEVSTDMVFEDMIIDKGVFKPAFGMYSLGRVYVESANKKPFVRGDIHCARAG